MKWETIISHQNELNEYDLMEGELRKIVLKYNPHQHSARFNYKSNCRSLFYFEPVSQSSLKITFNNEYDEKTAEILLDNIFDGSGSLMLENKMFYFQLLGDPVDKFSIYEKEMNTPIVSCTISPETDPAVINCFLLGTCFYILMEITKGAHAAINQEEPALKKTTIE